MTNKEVRSFEFRALDEENGDMVLEGYAAKFESRSELLGNFYETIQRGAFSDVLQNDVVALLNHDSNYVLARSSNGTLSLTQDETGLKATFKIADTSYGRDVWKLVKEGLLERMSFAFQVGKDSWGKVDGTPLRKIESVSRLFDVSVVTYPAYPETSIAARDMATALSEKLAEASEDTKEEGLALKRKHTELERQLKLFQF